MNPEDIMQAVADDEHERAIAEKKEEMKLSPEEKKKNAWAGHRERVRQRFLQTGIDGFAPHEMLELLLLYAVPRRDTKQIAKELLSRFGGIAGVFDAPVSQLTEIPYITENAAVLIKLVPRLIGVYYADENKSVSITNTSMLTNLFKPYFVGTSTEKFLLACFDSNLRVKTVTEISSGTSAYAAIEMRKIMSEALRSECTMAALAHNHPGNSPKPSDNDVVVTRRIGNLLKEIDVKLMDHIIIGSGRTYSMRDGGDLSIFD